MEPLLLQEADSGLWLVCWLWLEGGKPPSLKNTGLAWTALLLETGPGAIGNGLVMVHLGVLGDGEAGKAEFVDFERVGVIGFGPIRLR